MATGAEHKATSILMAVPSGILLYTLEESSTFALAGVIGCLSGIVLSPDLDMVDQNHNITPEQVMGRFRLQILFSSYWWFYGWCIPHRSVFSHLPLLGTVLRVMYMSIFPMVVLTVLLYLEALSPVTLIQMLESIPPAVVWGWLAGLFLSDFYHWVLDGFPPLF